VSPNWRDDQSVSYTSDSRERGEQNLAKHTDAIQPETISKGGSNDRKNLARVDEAR
jgi:hypothetical protein